MASLNSTRNSNNARRRFLPFMCPFNASVLLSLVLSLCALPKDVATYTYDDYMKACVGPVDSNEFEILFDYEKRSNCLAEYSQFDPKKLMEDLSRSAAGLSIPPAQFHAEVQKMVHHSFEFSSDALTELEIKYNISVHGEDPDSLTRARLRLMFPHYADISQKPFRSYYWKKFAPNSNRTIPAPFSYEHFGGLVPRSGALSDNERRVIIALHLYSLMLEVTDKSERFLCRLLKERIEKSLLSNERRILVLQNNDILSKKKEIRDDIWKAFNEIPNNFVSDICWDILNQ